MTLPCFIDFEASGLGLDSYPLEVAWSYPDGTIESHLIQPECTWRSWSKEAEKLHGLSWIECMFQGTPPRKLMKILSNIFDERTPVYCDGGALDKMWLEEIYLSGFDNPNFYLFDTRELLMGLIDNQEDIYEQLKKESRDYIGKRHRAGPDVAFQVEFYKRCQGYSKTITLFDKPNIATPLS